MGNKTIQSAKRAIGAAAAQLVQDGMVVGIGTGTTAACFIDALADRCHAGLSITGVATSKASAQQAIQGGISVVDIDAVSSIDIAIDGADEIDPEKRLIKGGGGALLREKLIASTATEMVVMVDQTKLVDRLGTFGLPIEVLPFGHTHTIRQLKMLGYHPHLRERHPGDPYVTDNGNFLCDLQFTQPISDPEKLDQEVRQLPGVIETGLFLNLAGRVVLGHADGHIEIEA